MKLALKKNLKQRVKIINELLKDENFLVSLCDYGNNDVARFISNLSLIINYYLNSKNFIVSKDVKHLLEIIKPSEFDNNYIFYVTNEYLKKDIQKKGIDFNKNSLKYLFELKQIEREVTINGVASKEERELFSDLDKALITAFTFPKIFYKSILKVPQTEEQDYTVDEVSHYYAILEKRLENVPEKTGAFIVRKAKKWFNAFIGQKPNIVVIPRKLVKDKILPFNLTYIELPTWYTIEQICNKKKAKEETQETKKEENRYYVTYSRLEELPINMDFIYSNSEFTGDTDYDVDLIYGALDFNGTRSKISSSSYVNIQKIKDTYDFVVKKFNGKYEIKNGRHRLLYMKNFYLANYEFYKAQGKLDFLQKMVSLIVNVEHCIEDDNVNKLLKRLVDNFEAKFIKFDNSNDDVGLIIVIDNKAYVVNNLTELEEFTNKIETRENLSKYYLSLYKEDVANKYNTLFNYLIITLKEKIYTMNLLDIINYILENGYYIEGIHYEVKEIDYWSLYNKYLVLRSSVDFALIKGNSLDIVHKTEKEMKLLELGKIIKTIILSNSEYLSLDWDKLVVILKENPILSDIDDKMLLEAANMVGYQALRYQRYFTDNNSKLLKVW